MKKVALLIAALSIVAISFAENTDKTKKEKKETTETSTTANQSVISGQVIDELTGEALAGVKVMLAGTNQEVYTDFDGNFSIQSEGTSSHMIKTDFISYKASVHSNVNTGKIKIALSAL